MITGQGATISSVETEQQRKREGQTKKGGGTLKLAAGAALYAEAVF